MAELNFSLWDFSLRVYALPEVATECLTLQDTYGADVNILLWALWLETQQKRLDKDQLQRALQLVSPWANAAVIPLRHIRRQLKNQYGTTDSQIENLRQIIKRAELQAEEYEQSMLQALVANWSNASSPVNPGDNLFMYLALLEIPVTDREMFATRLTKLISS